MENEDSLKTLHSDNNVLREQYNILFNTMEQIETKIKENIIKIQGLCVHEYVSEVEYGARTSYYCPKCGHYQ